MPRQGYKTITVPEQLYNRLNDVRRRERLASMSDVINYLLAVYEQGSIKVVAPTFNVDADNEHLKNYIKDLRRKLGLDNTEP